MKNNTIVSEIHERLEEYFESADMDDIVALYNIYCDKVNSDGYIYDMDDFNNIMSSITPWDVARAIYYSSRFHPFDCYFYINAHGNCSSLNFWQDCDCFYIDEVINYIIEHEEDFGNSKVAEIIKPLTELEAYED